MAEKNRYTDQELQEFKAILSDKLEGAQKELKYYQDQIRKTDGSGQSGSDYKFNGLEDGAITQEKEFLNKMAARQIQYISHLNKAMVRIENKTYGICRETGNLISKDRLKAVPHATLSIDAKKAEKK